MLSASLFSFVKQSIMQKIPVQILDDSTFAVDSKIHVRLTEGFFQHARRLISWPLLFIYFALVWIQVDGQPWLLFDQECLHIKRMLPTQAACNYLVCIETLYQVYVLHKV